VHAAINIHEVLLAAEDAAVSGSCY